MATLGKILEPVSLGGTQGTVGAYLRQYPSGATTVLFRYQAAGAAGTFVSPAALAAQYGKEFVERISAAVMAGLSVLPTTGVSGGEGIAFKQFNAPMKLIPSGGENWLFKTGAIPLAASPGFSFNVSGEYGQVLLVLQRADTFMKGGQRAVETAVSEHMEGIITGLLVRIRALADQIVMKNVYNTPATVHRARYTERRSAEDLGGRARKRRGITGNLYTTSKMTLGQYLRESSIALKSWPYDRTYQLRNSVHEGIRSLHEGIGGYGIIIGIDEEMLMTNTRTGESEATPYSIFVEHGHRVIIPNRGGLVDTGSYVSPRPFMGEIIQVAQEFMQEFVKSVRTQDLQKRVGDMVFSWINNVRGAVSTRKGKYTIEEDFPYGQVSVKTQVQHPLFLREYF